MRRVLAVLAALVLAGCSQAPSTELRSGRYSGSTTADTPITIEVAGSQIRVNSRKAMLKRPDDNRTFTAVRMTGKPVFSCTPVDRHRELRCEVTWPDRTETIELMKE